MHSRQLAPGPVYRTTMALMQYCKERNWAGFDPYDALNSRLYGATPFTRSRICNIAVTQVMKRLPVNIRQLLLIPPRQNPKALALFLSAQLKLLKLGVEDRDDLTGQLVESLVALREADNRYFCWGYSFPWQTRGVLVPSGVANLVCTSFVANALLDAYESLGDRACLEMGISAAQYVLNVLYWEKEEVAGFSYPLPNLRILVPNANFLAAALLSRAYHLSGDSKFLAPALKAARHSVALQLPNGAWKYGELATQQWVDNFHTGYNLCALRFLGRYAGTDEFERALRSGFSFYTSHFFTEEGAPKYFHDRTYPLDIHCVAQSIITFLQLADLDPQSASKARLVTEWALAHMWDERGYFYYQIHPLYTNRISYMRWSQAWMLLALCTVLEHGAAT